MHNLNAGDAGLVQPSLKLSRKFLRRQRNKSWPPANRLSKHFVDIAAGRKRGNLVAFGKLLNDGQSALANGARRTENGKSLQFTVYILENLVDNLSVPQRRSGQQQRIDAVQHAAVAG